MGPLWCGQGTVPHTTTSDLLSTDVILSPSGAPVGAEKVDIYAHQALPRIMYIPADVALVEEVTVLLKILVPNSAVTLTLQLLPGAVDNM